MGIPGLLFAYVGPDTLLPLASGIAGVVGLFLVFGRNTLRFAVKFCRLILRKSACR